MGSAISRRSPTPREPLSFLYPRWFTTEPTAQCRKKNTNELFQHPKNRKFSKGRLVNQQENEGPRRAPLVASTESRIGRDEAESVEAGDMPAGVLSNVRRREVVPGSTFATERMLDVENEAINMRCGSVSTYGNRNNLRVRRLLQAAKTHETSERLREEARRAYQMDRRQSQGYATPDWRIILEDLKRHTPKVSTQWLEDALRVVIPSNAVRPLLYGIDNNIWELKGSYGCEIQLEGSSRKDGRRTLLFSGHKPAIIKAAVHIMKIVPGAQSQDGLLHDSVHDGEIMTRRGSVERVARLVRARDHSTMRIPIRADEAPRPEDWTETSFAEYVEHLTSIEMPNHMHSMLYGKGEYHTESVGQLLLEAFKLPDTRHAITTVAFRNAVGFLVKTNQIHQARSLFTITVLQGLPADTEVFNIMLRGAAKAKDLHNFAVILRNLLKTGYQPNSGTWVALIATVNAVKIKQFIWSEMQQHGLLRNTSTLKAVVAQLAWSDMEASLAKLQTTEEFMHVMDARYGPDWLSLEAANRILHSMAVRGQSQRMLQFLDHMNSRWILPNTVSFNTIVGSYIKQDDIDGLVLFIKSVSQSFYPDAITYHTIFEKAWTSRLYNVARVTWKFACMNVSTTNTMRAQVKKSLSQQSLVSSPTRGEIWHATAGKFICYSPPLMAASLSGMKRVDKVNSQTATTETGPNNVNIVGVQDADDNAQKIALESSSCSKESAHLHPQIFGDALHASSASTSKTSNTQALIDEPAKSTFNSLWKEEMQLSKRYRAARPWADMLAEAYVKDKELSHMRHLIGASPDVLAKHVIDIPTVTPVKVHRER